MKILGLKIGGGKGEVREVKPGKEYRKYIFKGIRWEHKPLNTEQWSMMQELMFGEEVGGRKSVVGGQEEPPPESPPAERGGNGRGGQDAHPTDIRGRMMARGVMEKALAILLVPEDREFDSFNMGGKAEIFKQFPAEWAMEVMGDFFRLNPCCGGIMQMCLMTESLKV